MVDLQHIAAPTPSLMSAQLQTPTFDLPLVRTSTSGQDGLLGEDALVFLAALHTQFEPGRQACLAARAVRQAAYDAGALPDFRSDTAALRQGDWSVAPIPPALLRRQVEITGPVDPKMVINALNSGADCFMADFEDSTSPTWPNLIAGQCALRDAVSGTLTFTGSNGKTYALVEEDRRAVLIVRPRGWHLDEKHVEFNGRAMSAALFDFGVFAFHNARALAGKDRGPYFYLPKLQSMEEAALWESVMAFAEAELGLVHGQMKVTVLIETLPAAFEMEEILYALRHRIVGLNCGRWDYIFSYIKTLRMHRDRVLPERGQVTMLQPFLKAYSELLIQTCHRRGAFAMGGMAAQVPINNDPVANDAAMARVSADKQREAGAGHDGTWVAHPGLIPIARAAFADHVAGDNQLSVRRDDVSVRASDLLAPCTGTITRAGFDNNVEVCVRYLAAWLSGNGCVPIHHLMEDAATAEISRAQLWQWIHHGGIRLDDGRPVDFDLLECALIGLPSRLVAANIVGASHIDDAIALLVELTHADSLADFLTLPAYQRLP
jgi:malate synthase